MSNDGDLVRWEPDFDEKELGDVARIKADMEQRASVFRELREKLGMSQSEFAKLIGRSQSNVSKLEARTDTRLALIRDLLAKRGASLRLVVDMGEGKSFELTGT
jgi:DNA-binding XRE family transcriptional regulator